MKKQFKLLIILFCILMIFSSCSSELMKEIETNLADAGNRIINGQSDDKVELATFAGQSDTNTHQINDDVIINDPYTQIKYNIKSAKIYDSLKDANISANELTEFSNLINLNPDGELYDDCNIIIVQAEITNLMQNQNDDLLCSDIILTFPDFNEDDFLENLNDGHSLNDSRFFYGIPSFQVDYFSFTQTETATRSAIESEYYHYSLNENETITINLGYIIRTDIIDNYDSYLRIGTNVDTVQYVQLFKQK